MTRRYIDVQPWRPDPRSQLFLNAVPPPLIFSVYNKMIEIDPSDFNRYDNSVIVPVNGILYFYSNRCMFCQQVVPIIEQFAQTYGNLKVLRFSIDNTDNAQFANFFHQAILKRPYRGVPEFYQLKNGKIIPPNFEFNRSRIEDYLRLATQ